MAAGYRVRVLLEWYDPDGTEEEEQLALDHLVKQIEPLLPSNAWSQVYIEPNPPDDEVEFLSTRR